MASFCCLAAAASASFRRFLSASVILLCLSFSFAAKLLDLLRGLLEVLLRERLAGGLAERAVLELLGRVLERVLERLGVGLTALEEALLQRLHPSKRLGAIEPLVGEVLDELVELLQGGLRLGRRILPGEFLQRVAEEIEVVGGQRDGVDGRRLRDERAAGPLVIDSAPSSMDSISTAAKSGDSSTGVSGTARFGDSAAACVTAVPSMAASISGVRWSSRQPREREAGARESVAVVSRRVERQRAGVLRVAPQGGPRNREQRRARRKRTSRSSARKPGPR